MGYGVELSVTYASLLIRRVLAHLGRYGIAPEEVVVQTDRGGEFSGQERTRRGFGFVYTVRELCGAEHTYIPPRWPNANADVEAFHRLVEEEFFELERFGDREEFLVKVTLYQHYFNFARPNSYKGGRTPWPIVEADRPGIRPEVLALPPVLLEAEYQRLALSPNSWDTQREAVRVCSRRNSAGDFIPSAECGATSL